MIDDGLKPNIYKPFRNNNGTQQFDVMKVIKSRLTPLKRKYSKLSEKELEDDRINNAGEKSLEDDELEETSPIKSKNTTINRREDNFLEREKKKVVVETISRKKEDNIPELCYMLVV